MIFLFKRVKKSVFYLVVVGVGPEANQCSFDTSNAPSNNYKYIHNKTIKIAKN